MIEKVDIDEKLKIIAEQLPEVMNAFSGLHSKVVKDGALSSRTKELIIVGIAVTLHCDYCLWKHVPETVKWRATRSEILEAVSTAILMAGGPAVAYGSVVVLEILDKLGI